MEKMFYLQNHKDMKIACVLHESENKSENLIIFCHGFGSSKSSNQGLFVELARKLCDKGYNVLRLDFPCNGDSEGNFIDNDFNDWILTIKSIALQIPHKKLGLIGNSMGGSAIIYFINEQNLGQCFVSWVPDPKYKTKNIPDELKSTKVNGIIEERGTRVKTKFWKEVYNRDFSKALKNIKIPGLIFIAEKDIFLKEGFEDKMRKSVGKNIQIEKLHNVGHGLDNYKIRQAVIKKTIDFFISNF